MTNVFNSTESGSSDDDDSQPGTSGAGCHVYATRSYLGGPVCTPCLDDIEYSDDDELDRFMSNMLRSTVRKEESSMSNRNDHGSDDIQTAYTRTQQETTVVRTQRAKVANEIDDIKYQLAQLEVNNLVAPDKTSQRVGKSFTNTTTTPSNVTTKAHGVRPKTGKSGDKNSKCKIKSSKVKSDVVAAMIRAEDTCNAELDNGDMNGLLDRKKPVLSPIGERKLCYPGDCDFLEADI